MISRLLVLQTFMFGSANAKESAAAVYPRLVIEKGPRALRWQPIAKLKAFRYSDGRWAEVPIQVDERNRRGDYVLNSGLPFTKDSDDEYVDDNDDVVLWGPHFGEIFSKAQIDRSILDAAERLWRVELKSGEKSFGWLLVVVSKENDDQKSDLAAPLVAFDAAKGIVRTAHYKYTFRDKQAALLGQVELVRAGISAPLFKDSQFILDLRLPWYLPDFYLTERNFSSAIESWREGPLRTIVAVGVKFSGFLSLFDLHLFTELSFSPRGFQIPTVIEFPFDPKSRFKSGTGIAYGISFADDLDWQLQSNLESLPDESPQALYDSAKRASDYPYFYAIGKSSLGDVIVRVNVDRKAAAQSLPPYLVKASIDPESFAAHWPWVERLGGDVRVFLDISGVRRGSYDFGLDLILDDEASEDMIAEVDALRTNWSGITHSSR